MDGRPAVRLQPVEEVARSLAAARISGNVSSKSSSSSSSGNDASNGLWSDRTNGSGEDDVERKQQDGGGGGGRRGFNSGWEKECVVCLEKER